MTARTQLLEILVIASDLGARAPTCAPRVTRAAAGERSQIMFCESSPTVQGFDADDRAWFRRPIGGSL